ncbi:MAG: CPBP family intramembrane glutamic endopeptidase [Tissierellaceae bacterium]|nr:CPBP family intramembrane glutamic endopeptidase [Tissierellaceae bacterium]
MFEVNLLYLGLGILLLTVGAFVQHKELYSGLLITEYILILLPCLLFLKIKGQPIKEVLRLNRIGLKQVFLIIGITIFTYPIAVFFQAIFYAILNLFKEVAPSSVPMPYDGLQYLISFFIIALAPGICEEVMFRGVMLDSYSSLGYRKSIVISAFLFGMFHFNLLNFVGPTILGIVFGIAVYKTNSIFTSMIGHTLNNGIALTIGFFLNKYGNKIDEMLVESSGTTESISSDFANFIPLIFLFLCFIAVKVMLNKLEPYDTNINDKEEISNIPRPFEKIKYFPIIIVIFLFIIINWIYLLV